MIIVWSVVVAIALLAEFLMYNMVSAWFAAGGLVALISAPIGLPWPWQILLFFVVSFICLLGLRRFVVQFMRVKTVPTNADANVGKRVKLLKDVSDSRSEIKLFDVIWTVSVACDESLLKGDLVEIIGMEGNKYIVQKASDEKAAPATAGNTTRKAAASTAKEVKK